MNNVSKIIFTNHPGKIWNCRYFISQLEYKIPNIPDCSLFTSLWKRNDVQKSDFQLAKNLKMNIVKHMKTNTELPIS